MLAALLVAGLLIERLAMHGMLEAALEQAFEELDVNAATRVARGVEGGYRAVG